MEGIKLISPTNGVPLYKRGDHLLYDGETYWPLVDNIAYLRPKEDVRATAVSALRENDVRKALTVLLADQDDFSPTPPPAQQQLDQLLDGPEVTLREAMQLLNYGPVGTYFAYRWCSPTFLSGLRLLRSIASKNEVTVEYACGIGHFLRELEQQDHKAIGVDIVYSKLWLARNLLGVRGPLVCGDVERSSLVAAGHAGAVFCHDAFYFLADKQSALDHMRAALRKDGRLAIGHAHTDKDPHQTGHNLSTNQYRALTEVVLYDDASMADEVLGGCPKIADESSAAIAWVEGQGGNPATFEVYKVRDDYAKNPLIGDGHIEWPSAGWRAEFNGDAARMEYDLTAKLQEASQSGSMAEAEVLSTVNLPPRW